MIIYTNLPVSKKLNNKNFHPQWTTKLLLARSQTLRKASANLFKNNQRSQYKSNLSQFRAFKCSTETEYKIIETQTTSLLEKAFNVFLDRPIIQPFTLNCDDPVQSQNHNQKRGPYNKYTEEQKRLALERINQGESPKQISLEMSIPVKNLKRWIDNGISRKKGAGRKKMDSDLESQLYDWCITESIQQKKPVSRRQIREQALHFSKHPEKFKASKGWTDKFVKKFNLRKRIIRFGQYIMTYFQRILQSRGISNESSYESQDLHLKLEQPDQTSQEQSIYENSPFCYESLGEFRKSQVKYEQEESSMIFKKQYGNHDDLEQSLKIFSHNNMIFYRIALLGLINQEIHVLRKECSSVYFLKSKIHSIPFDEKGMRLGDN